MRVALPGVDSMRRILLAGCLLFSAVCGADVPAFAQVQVFKVQGSEKLDLSGLALCQGGLYTISDKVSDKVFRIRWHGANPEVVVARQLPALPPREIEYSGTVKMMDRLAGPGLDWEDIACHDGDFYLLSERRNAILGVSGRWVEWLEPDWYDALHRQGFLNRYNAMVEGFARIDARHWLLALEREPRGLAVLTREDSGWRARGFALGNEQHLKFRADNADVSALALHGGALYTLERNASAVCRRDLQQFRARSCYSYAAIENDPRYRYADNRYGQAEGLAMDDDWIYIVFDNNGGAFAADAQDRRALLLKTPMPADWREG